MAALKQKHHVLVVEDNADIRDLVMLVLEGLQFDVTTAANGQQALGLLRSGGEQFSIVLLDLMMPVMTGWQLIEEMRKDEQLCEIPVVVTSAIAEAFPSCDNVVAHLTKPIMYSQLVEIIYDHIGRVPSGGASSASSVGPVI